jgi:hypothetical protein
VNFYREEGGGEGSRGMGMVRYGLEREGQAIGMLCIYIYISSF